MESKAVEVSVRQARKHLCELLLRVAEGEEIVIARSGRPIAKLIPYEEPPGERVLGQDRGKIVMADDFDTPLPDEVQRHFVH